MKWQTCMKTQTKDTNISPCQRLNENRHKYVSNQQISNESASKTKEQTCSHDFCKLWYNQEYSSLCHYVSSRYVTGKQTVPMHAWYASCYITCNVIQTNTNLLLPWWAQNISGDPQTSTIAQKPSACCSGL